MDLTPQQLTPGPVGRTSQRDVLGDLPWYHLCRRCEAKWFAPRRKMRCPRCGRMSKSPIPMRPPWQCR